MRLIIQEVGLLNSTLQLVANLKLNFFLLRRLFKAALLINLERVEPPLAFRTMKKWLVINCGASFRYLVHARRLTKCINSASNEDTRQLTSSLALLWSINWPFWSAKLSLRTLNSASAASNTWTVEAGCLASLINVPACVVSLPSTSFPTKIVILSAKLVEIGFLNYSKSWILLYSCTSIKYIIILRANLLNL
jgi:hypothetical protein